MLPAHKTVIDNLAELDLTPHEAEVYLAVLEGGEVPAGYILDQLPLHREQVYRALKRLVDSRLLTTYVKRKRSYYSAVSPDVLVKRQEQKTALARSLQPYLQHLHQNRPQIIQVSEDPNALDNLLEDITDTLPEDSEYLVLGGVGDLFYEKTRESLPRHSKRFAKKKIGVRIVAFSGQDYSREQQLIGTQVRYLSQPMGGPTATVIYGNKVAIEIFDPHNFAVITIENEFLANSYRQTFEAIWEMSK